MKYYTAYSLFIFFISFIGCTSTKVIESWKAPDRSGHQYKKILVLGINQPNYDDRKLMENKLADRLRKLGYQATPAHELYGSKAFADMEELKAVRSIRDSSFGAVLTVVLLHAKNETRFMPSNEQYAPFGLYNERFGVYKSTLTQLIYQPQSYYTSNRYYWQTNFYDQSTHQLLYSIQMESYDPDDAKSMAKAYAKTLTKRW